MSAGSISEISLVDRIKKLVKNDSSVVCGIGDDAAVIAYTKDRYLLYTVDMLIEGVDFTNKALPGDLGHKALACSLSDIAAMGGIPRHALVSLGLRRSINKIKFIEGFYKGMSKLAKRFKVSIVGGDLSASEKTVIDVFVVGEVERGRLVLRSSAKVGDSIFVSGSLGGSIYGKHLSFVPRIDEARYLTGNYKINSMIDISDGLSLDLYRMCKSSRVGAVIYEELIPVSRAAKSKNEALYMGEDFELLFTLSAKEARRLIKEKGDVFRKIGSIVKERRGLKLITQDALEKDLEIKGYQHF